MATKLESADAVLSHGMMGRGTFGGLGGGGGKSAEAEGDGPLGKPASAAVGLAVESAEGQMTQIVKKTIFG